MADSTANALRAGAARWRPEGRPLSSEEVFLDGPAPSGLKPSQPRTRRARCSSSTRAAPGTFVVIVMLARLALTDDFTDWSDFHAVRRLRIMDRGSAPGRS